MRIMHATYIYPPTLTAADGITYMVYGVTKELARRGHDVAVYTSNLLDLHGKNSLRADNVTINDVDVHYSRSLWRHKTFIVSPSIISSLLKNINNFDVVHIHDSRSFQGISSYLLSKAKNVPCVFQPHGSFLSISPESPVNEITRLALDNLISERIFRNTSKVIAVCNSEVEEYLRMGMPKDKIAVVPNGIDLSHYDNLPPQGCFRKKFSLDDNERILLYLGRIHRIKGVDLLVKAFAEVRTELDDVRLVIVGPDDGYLHELQALAEALKLEDEILITGPLYGRAKLEAYVDSDVYLLPSRYEVWGITVLEAYACGRPVIASRVGGLQDLVMHGETGLLVEPGSVEQLAKSILLMLNDKSDKAREMGRKSKQFVKANFSIEKVVDKLENLYREVSEVHSSHQMQKLARI